jgi:hypothetical protein
LLLLGGRASAPLVAERVVATGLLGGVSAAAVNFGRLGARAGFRLLGGRWVLPARLLAGPRLAGRWVEPLRSLGC